MMGSWTLVRGMPGPGVWTGKVTDTGVGEMPLSSPKGFELRYRVLKGTGHQRKWPGWVNRKQES